MSSLTEEAFRNTRRMLVPWDESAVTKLISTLGVVFAITSCVAVQLNVVAYASNTAAGGDVIGRRLSLLSPPVSRRIIALYYPWYGTPDVSQSYRNIERPEPAAKRIGNFSHYPVSGPYDSLDVATIKRHLSELKAAGVDTLACSWSRTGDFTYVAMRRLLPLAQAAGLQVCVYLESLRRPSDVESAVQELCDAFVVPA